MSARSSTVEPVQTPAAGFPAHVDPAYVDGLLRWVTSSTGETASALAPFTGEPLPAVPQSSAADVHAAAARARSAQAAWADLPLSERLRRANGRIRALEQ